MKLKSLGFLYYRLITHQIFDELIDTLVKDKINMTDYLTNILFNNTGKNQIIVWKK